MGFTAWIGHVFVLAVMAIFYCAGTSALPLHHDDVQWAKGYDQFWAGGLMPMVLEEYFSFNVSAWNDSVCFVGTPTNASLCENQACGNLTCPCVDPYAASLSGYSKLQPSLVVRHLPPIGRQQTLIFYKIFYILL